MRFVILGDTHGRSYWQDIVRKEKFDKLIFTGDYFDTKEAIEPQVQLENFISICEFKRAHPSDVVLLIGNHDFHYMRGVWEEYSGFTAAYADRFLAAMKEPLKEKMLQLCFVHDNLLFTHAGVTKTWCRENSINMENIQQSINDLFSTNPECFYCFPENTEIAARTGEISPIWVRPNKLISDKIDDYTQVVGHTMQQQVVFVDGCVFIDALGTSGEYLVIEGGEFYVATVERD